MRDAVNLSNLVVEEATCTVDVSYLPPLPDLKELDLNYAENLINLHGVENVPSLRRFFVAGASKLTTLDQIHKLNSLEELHIHDAKLLTGLSGIEELRNLTKLILWDIPNLRNLDALRNFSRLKELRINGIQKLDINAVGQMRSLEELALLNIGAISGINELEKLVNLRKIIVEGYALDSEILTNLKSLNLHTGVEIFERQSMTVQRIWLFGSNWRSS